MALSAGAPLPERSAGALADLGCEICKNLYGQTESGVVTAQFEPFSAARHRWPALSGQRIRLLPDDEIIASLREASRAIGPDEADLREMRHADGITTGDIGTIDGRGILKIIDRKKDIVITAGGKNVSPSRIETLLKVKPLYQ